MTGKIILALVIFVAIFAGILVLTDRNSNQNQSNIKQTSSSLATYSTLTGVTWGSNQQAKEQTFYGNLSGEKITTTTSGEPAAFMNFENKETLKSQGFALDINLAADGPGSSNWGYSKTENGQTQIIIFSYQTTPSSTSANEPLQFNCPCKINVSIFESNPFVQYKQN